MSGFTKAFMLGYAEGKKVEPCLCPYEEGTQEQKDWLRGFDEASFVASLSRNPLALRESSPNAVTARC